MYTIYQLIITKLRTCATDEVRNKIWSELEQLTKFNFYNYKSRSPLEAMFRIDYPPSPSLSRPFWHSDLTPYRPSGLRPSPTLHHFIFFFLYRFLSLLLLFFLPLLLFLFHLTSPCANPLIFFHHSFKNFHAKKIPWITKWNEKKNTFFFSFSWFLRIFFPSSSPFFIFFVSNSPRLVLWSYHSFLFFFRSEVYRALNCIHFWGNCRSKLHAFWNCRPKPYAKVSKGWTKIKRRWAMGDVQSVNVNPNLPNLYS